MARPIKTGLDYFPLDVDIDDKIELIEAKHGLTGFAIVIKLWQRIYKNGYYIEWEHDKELLFARRLNVGVNELNEVVNSCLHWNLFDYGLHEKYKILTSSGIQKRYITACAQSKRKAIAFIEPFNLLTPELTKLITEFTQLTQEESTQSKVKESKVKESKVKDVSKLSLTEREKIFMDELSDLVSEFGKETVRSFFNYWSEPNKQKTKMRFELEKTWDTKRRLTTWKNRENSLPGAGPTITNRGQPPQPSKISQAHNAYREASKLLI